MCRMLKQTGSRPLEYKQMQDYYTKMCKQLTFTNELLCYRRFNAAYQKPPYNEQCQKPWSLTNLRQGPCSTSPSFIIGFPTLTVDIQYKLNSCSKLAPQGPQHEPLTQNPMFLHALPHVACHKCEYYTLMNQQQQNVSIKRTKIKVTWRKKKAERKKSTQFQAPK